MTNNCKLLPEINECKFLTEWKVYEKSLYEIFKNMFISKVLIFEDRPIRIKQYPKYNEYETAFIHLICRKEVDKSIGPNDREPDLRRAERLHWIKCIIDNYPCLEECMDCEGILLYKEYYNGNVNRLRVKLFLPIERYIIVLEDHKTYYLMITAFYIDNDRQLKKYYQKYLEYKKQETPII